MAEQKRIVALIPLRGGSKSIPKKNIKLIAGRPLCAWVLKAASKVREIDEIYVSTDDDEIAEIVKSLDLNVKILKRPSELATDEATTESVMLHFAENIKFDILILMQATSPLTIPDDLKRGIEKFSSEKLNSLVTGVRTKRFFWDTSANPINYDFRKRPRRQEFEGWIMENGAFYITDRPTLMETECRLGGKIGILEMAAETAIEIDEPEDWLIVEGLLRKKQKEDFPKLLENIRLFALDNDGTFTDGGMYYSENGEVLKKFNTRDAKGLELLSRKGITIAIITGEDSEIVRARARKLRINHVYCGVKDKVSVLETLCAQLGISLKQTAFIGDDLNDIDCFDVVGFTACPSDANDMVKQKANYICQKKGGKGAVREVCDLIVSCLSRLDENHELKKQQ